MTRTRKLVAVTVLLTIAATAMWQAYAVRSDPSGGAGPTSGVALFPGNKGIPLPEVEGRTLEGERIALADLRGTVVVLNVWGSWCAPCRAEVPELKAVAAQTSDEGVQFMGIDVRDNPAAARAFQRRFGIEYPSIDDRSGLVLAQFAGVIPVSAVPSTVVADRSGMIRARVVGRVDAVTLRGLIDDAGASS